MDRKEEGCARFDTFLKFTTDFETRATTAIATIAASFVNN